ncbi:hypothetical protein BGZ98_000028 [Dissophora globulifera]|nr:hypothetical protein BGZ98_000028 [Dissophora globulifera]
MVKLRVRVGGSYTDLAIINCNDEHNPLEFETPDFKGRAVVRIRDFVGITSDGSPPIHNSEYFKGHNRRFSIQVEGRFKRQWDGEQVYFGTDFDRSVRLPTAFDVMFKVAQYIDPVVKTSLSEDGKPWILSPLVSSINVMNAWRPQDANLPSPPVTPRQSTDMSRNLAVNSEHNSSWGFLGKLKRGNRSSVHSVTSVSSSMSNDVYSQGGSPRHSSENLDIIQPRFINGTQLSGSPMSTTPNSMDSPAEDFDDSDMPLGHWRQHLEEDTAFFKPNASNIGTAKRRKYFQTEETRRQFVFNPHLVHGFEFFAPYMNFNTGGISIGGISLNVFKYLNGQPVRYTCRTLEGDTVFFVIQFELVD